MGPLDLPFADRWIKTMNAAAYLLLPFRPNPRLKSQGSYMCVGEAECTSFYLHHCALVCLFVCVLYPRASLYV